MCFFKADVLENVAIPHYLTTHLGKTLISLLKDSLCKFGKLMQMIQNWSRAQLTCGTPSHRMW